MTTIQRLTIAVFAAVVILTACTCAGVQRTITADEQWERGVVIGVPFAGTHVPMGSGVLYDGKHVLTAWHVIEGAGQSSLIVQWEGRAIKAVVIRTSPAHDLALLRLETAVKVPRLVVGRPRDAEPVCLVGKVPKPVRRCGLVQMEFSRDGPGDLDHSGFTWFGNSGSGAYSKHGELLGIVTHLVRCGGGGRSNRMSPGMVCSGRITTLYDRWWILP